MLIMNHELIPPIHLAPPSVGHLPVSKRIELWADLVDSCQALLIAGLRKRIGPEGDLQAAYREWNQKYLENRERAQIQFLENLSRRESGNVN
jgi:hypothetical protein